LIRVDYNKVKVILAWVFLVAMVFGTIWDWIHNKTEPLHVLILSWGAMDVSAAQILIAVLTRKEVQESSTNTDTDNRTGNTENSSTGNN
jgi:hypothetical protein